MFKNHQRNVEPAVYYSNRLTEQPVPILELDEPHNEAAEDGDAGVPVSENQPSTLGNTSNSQNEVFVENDNSVIGQIDISNEIMFDPLENTPDAQNKSTNGQQESCSDGVGLAAKQTGNSNETDTLLVREELPFDDSNESFADAAVVQDATTSCSPTISNIVENTQHELSSEESRGLLPMEAVFINGCPAVKEERDEIVPDDILNDLIGENATTVIDDDISITIGFEGIPKPFAANCDNMIKREEDPISNNIPYNLTVYIVWAYTTIAAKYKITSSAFISGQVRSNL